MTDDLIERAKACPDISHARIVAPGDRVPEVVMPTATRDALCARIATQQEAIDELVAGLGAFHDYHMSGGHIGELASIEFEGAALLSKHG